MIEGEVTSRRALRDAYRDAIADRLEEDRLTLSSGELDGVPVVTIANIEKAIAEIFSGPPPGTPDGFAEVATPANVLVHAECPRCGIPAEINVVMGAVLTVDSDGAELSAKAKSKARTHICGQLSMPLADPVADGQTSIDFDGIVGPTTQELVVDREPVEPVDLAETDDDACAAEAEVPNLDDPTPGADPTILLVCDRKVDHEGDHYSGTDEEGEKPIAWHYETVPVPQGVAGNEDAPIAPADGEEGGNDGNADD